MAVGSSKGHVQLHNLLTNNIDREYFIQNTAVQGLKVDQRGFTARLHLPAHHFADSPGQE